MLPPESAAIAKAHYRRLPLVSGQCLLDAHGEPDRAGAFQPAGVRPAKRAAVWRAVLAACLLRRLEPLSPTTTIGPKPSPLGLSADPGGLPLYKNGTFVGAIGVISGTDLHARSRRHRYRPDPEELIAVAGTFGFAAPTAYPCRPHRRSTGGRCSYTDSETLLSDPAMAPPFASINGSVGALFNFPGYGGNPILAGHGIRYRAFRRGARPRAHFRRPECVARSSTPPATTFRAEAGTDGLLPARRSRDHQQWLDIANRARAQIRQPLGRSPRSHRRRRYQRQHPRPLAPARRAGLRIDVAGRRRARRLSSPAPRPLPRSRLCRPPTNATGATSYDQLLRDRVRTFFNDPTVFANGIAFHRGRSATFPRPFFPDGIAGTANGPFEAVSQLEHFRYRARTGSGYNNFVAPLTTTRRHRLSDCTGIQNPQRHLRSSPAAFRSIAASSWSARSAASGDGTDQSDLIAFLGLEQCRTDFATGIGNAPPAMRADQLVPQGQGTRLRYVNCPQCSVYRQHGAKCVRGPLGARELFSRADAGLERLAALRLAAAQTTLAQAPTTSPTPAVKQARPGAGPAAPAQSADGRYGIVVLATTLNVHEEPTASSPVIVKLEQGLRLDADRRRGNWYHVSLPEGRSGWINYVVGKAAPDFSVDASPGIARTRPGGESGAPRPVEAAAPGAAPEAATRRRGRAQDPGRQAARRTRSHHRSLAGAPAVAAVAARDESRCRIAGA